MTTRKERKKFPPIGPEAMALCDRAWDREGDMDEVFSNGFNQRITRQDLGTLAEGQELNDNIIMYYLNLIADRSQKNPSLLKVYSFETFFYENIDTKEYSSVRRWTKKVDIFAHDVLLIPVHVQSNHWCMAIVDFVQKNIDYFDSLHGGDNGAFMTIKKYLGEESRDKKKVEFSFRGWNFNDRNDCPKQTSNCDCGVFATHVAEYYSRRAPLTFTQGNMEYFRMRMVFEIVSKKLINTTYVAPATTTVPSSSGSHTAQLKEMPKSEQHKDGSQVANKQQQYSARSASSPAMTLGRAMELLQLHNDHEATSAFASTSTDEPAHLVKTTQKDMTSVSTTVATSSSSCPATVSPLGLISNYWFISKVCLQATGQTSQDVRMNCSVKWHVANRPGGSCRMFKSRWMEDREERRQRSQRQENMDEMRDHQVEEQGNQLLVDEEATRTGPTFSCFPMLQRFFTRLTNGLTGVMTRLFGRR